MMGKHQLGGRRRGGARHIAATTGILLLGALAITILVASHSPSPFLPPRDLVSGPSWAPVVVPQTAPTVARSGSAGASHEDYWVGRCVGVSDGDTISVMHDGKSVKIRLNGVDCPELHQAYGTKAKKATSDLVFGDDVTIEPVKTDRYGRTVARVYAQGGASLEEALVADGLAWWYQQYAPEETRLQTLEEAARRAQKGLWADPNPVAPWDYRKEHRR